MDDVLSSSPRVPREVLRDLMHRGDGPAALRLLASLTVFIAAAISTATLAAADNLSWLPAAIVGGLAYVTFFPALHESGHGTAFATPRLNRATAWFTALLMLQAPSFFREFHWEHHRQTQDRGLDPEIMAAPDLLDGWPRDIFTYLLLASGQLLIPGKLGFTVGYALLPAALRRRLFPYVRAAQDVAVARESRVALTILLALVTLGLLFVPGFWAILLIVPIGHLFLGLYLMPEHTGLANTGTQIHRTRTLRSNRWLRWCMWNMPYHAEHHAYPAVPFHALPRLHRILADELENVAPGYLAFHAEAIRRALRLQR